MKKMQNVLYVMSKGSKLSVKNQSICVTGKEVVTIPVHNIESIVCFGNMSITTPFIGFCSENNVKLSFLSEYGGYYGSFYGKQKGSVFLRTEQYRMFDDKEVCLNISKSIINTKIRNSIRVLGKSLSCSKVIKDAISDMSVMKNEISDVDNIDTLRGIEGIAAARYFSAFDEMINTDNSLMKFEKRTKRPPENNINALLSFVYTLLETDVTSAVECTGLDVQVGVMHTKDYGKPSLVLDMMEEYRAPLCDRFVIALVNRKQIRSDDFIRNDEGIWLTSEARKKVVVNWQERKQQQIFHTGIEKKINIGLIPYAQAQIMSACIRNKTPEYKPFLWR